MQTNWTIHFPYSTFCVDRGEGSKYSGQMRIHKNRMHSTTRHLSINWCLRTTISIRTATLHEHHPYTHTLPTNNTMNSTRLIQRLLLSNSNEFFVSLAFTVYLSVNRLEFIDSFFDVQRKHWTRWVYAGIWNSKFTERLCCERINESFISPEINFLNFVCFVSHFEGVSALE